MLYISKGAVKESFAFNSLIINIRGTEHHLRGERAALWIAGQFNVQEYAARPAALNELVYLGLVETADESGPSGYYYLLSRCIIIPAKPKMFRRKLSRTEEYTWQWISKAGLRLTVAELICLAQNRVEPRPEYLGSANRQTLVEAIYSTETISDNILENLMEHSEKRDETVDAVFGLLRKKRIILI